MYEISETLMPPPSNGLTCPALELNITDDADIVGMPLVWMCADNRSILDIVLVYDDMAQ